MNPARTRSIGTAAALALLSFVAASGLFFPRTQHTALTARRAPKISQPRSAEAAPVLARERAIDDNVPNAVIEPAVLLKTLCEQGRFGDAVQLAAEAPSELGRDWTFDIYVRWARREPEQAVAGLQLLQDETLRARALQAIIDTWVEDDPATLAMQISLLPRGELRAYTFREASRAWSQRDPTAMDAWVQVLAPGPERDLATAWLVASRESL